MGLLRCQVVDAFHFETAATERNQKKQKVAFYSAGVRYKTNYFNRAYRTL